VAAQRDGRRRCRRLEDHVNGELDRRTFLRRSAMGAAAGAVMLGGGGTLLAACGDDKSSTSSSSGGTAKFGTLDFQLSWIKNVEFAGEYLADTKGYYKAQGFDGVNLMAGGPNVQQDAVVASGKAFVCISAPDITASAINQGAAIIAVGAQYQKNPFCVMSLASKPIKTPQDMIGKKIGVQSVNEPVWNAFLKANNIDGSKINKVPVQFDPQPLTTGEVDGWFSFVTNEPNLLKTKGVDTVTFLLNDFGYPLVSEIYVVRKDSVSKDRDKIKALLKADIAGWQDSYKDPAAAPKLVVSTYGKDLGLDEAEQTLESKAQNELIFTSDTKTNGLFTITDKLVDETMATLKLAGINITKDKLFDLSIISEIYKDNPKLKTVS
jgi:ABC-type nitrate/sulfonate/bicarbonate transport system substrate-binding protein